jgi:Glycosyltransferase like family 2
VDHHRLRSCALVQLAALALIAWTHVGWDLFLRAALRLGLGRAASAPAGTPPPAGPVTVVVAAYAEAGVIAATVGALLAQDHPARVVVACDGSPDATAARAREAGAHVVLELPRCGKHVAQAAAVAHADTELLAFCDANTTWEPDALGALVAAFADPAVGYACGHVGFVRAGDAAAPNQEGAYWGRELATRHRESEWHSVTAGNGAIYALRATLWPRLHTDLGHDLALPHQVVRHGHLAVDVPSARASELMVPSLEGEWARKRRMMARAWVIIARDPTAGGLLDPRGLPPRYGLALASHRWIRYASPFLHVVALLDGLRRAVRGRPARLNGLALAAQLAVLAGAAAPSRARPLLLCRYYVLVTASIAAGLLDRLRGGEPEVGWAPAEGTR